VHEIRHASDAILVGIGTILADDPLLTDRSGLPRRRPLLRVILDSRLRLPLSSHLVESANEDVVVFCSVADESRRRDLEARGVRICQIEAQTENGRPDLLPVLAALGTEQITSVLVEGGAEVNWAFLRERLVDKLALFFAPTIFGPGSVPWLAGEGALPAGTLAATNLRIERFDEDFAVEAYLRDPYSMYCTQHCPPAKEKQQP